MRIKTILLLGIINYPIYTYMVLVLASIAFFNHLECSHCMNEPGLESFRWCPKFFDKNTYCLEIYKQSDSYQSCKALAREMTETNPEKGKALLEFCQQKKAEYAKSVSKLEANKK